MSDEDPSKAISQIKNILLQYSQKQTYLENLVKVLEDKCTQFGTAIEEIQSQSRQPLLSTHASETSTTASTKKEKFKDISIVGSGSSEGGGKRRKREYTYKNQEEYEEPVQSDEWPRLKNQSGTITLTYYKDDITIKGDTFNIKDNIKSAFSGISFNKANKCWSIEKNSGTLETAKSFSDTLRTHYGKQFIETHLENESSPTRAFNGSFSTSSYNSRPPQPSYSLQAMPQRHESSSIPKDDDYSDIFTDSFQ